MSVEVLEPGQRTLAELADVIEAEHRACTQALNSALLHALKAGEALNEAHQLVPAGDWMRWIEEIDISRTTVNTYVRLYLYRERLHPGMGIREARRHLSGLPQTYAYGGQDAIPDEVLKQGAELVKEHGLSLRAASIEIGCSQTTLWRYMNPEKARTINKRKAARQTEKNRIRRSLEREQEIKRAVRKADAALAEAYARAERDQDIVAQAQREATDPETKRILAEAGAVQRRYRDLIVKALGVAPPRGPRHHTWK